MWLFKKKKSIPKNIIIHKTISDITTLKSTLLKEQSTNNFLFITNSILANNSILIFGLSIKDVQTSYDYTFILTTDGTVYVVSHLLKPQNLKDEFWKGINFKKDCVDYFKFTKNDPIESISAKWGNNYAFITKKGEVYLSYKDKKYCGKLDQNLFENKKIIKVASGVDHILFLTSGSCVYSLGTTFNGKLGHGRNINYKSAFDYIFGKCNLDNILQNNNTKIIDIGASYNTSFFLTDNGQVFSCGDHTYGADAQPLNFNLIPNEFQLVENCKFVKEMIIGYFFGSFKTLDDKYQIFGLNNFNQFSNNFPTDKIYGPTDFNLQNSEIKQEDIYQLECGGYGTIIVTKNCKVYSTGAHSCLFLKKEDSNYQMIEHSDVFSKFIKDVKRFKVRCSVHSVVYFTVTKKEIVDIFNFKNVWKIVDCDFIFN
ncbi:hypothetical protein ABK040_004012 [Willaertia magna]